MKTLSKLHRDYILDLIKESNSVNRIKSYCLGAGFDTESYSSPVHITNNKLTLRYRRNNEYYYL